MPYPTGFHPQLIDATSATERMDALFRFVDFWLARPSSPRVQAAFAEFQPPLPIPLAKLYRYAVNPADGSRPFIKEKYVNRFTNGSTLYAPGELTPDSHGRLIFLEEAQGSCNWRTLPEGDDPPVWCAIEYRDLDGHLHSDEVLTSSSLSSFLTTYALIQLVLNSRRLIEDEVLRARFLSSPDSVVPVWIDAPYVAESEPHCNFYLWGPALAAQIGGGGGFSFAANDQEGLDFLEANRAPSTGPSRSSVK